MTQLARRVADERLRQEDQLQTRVNSELHDIPDAEAPGESAVVSRIEHAGLELEITNGRQRRWRADGRATRICVGNRAGLRQSMRGTARDKTGNGNHKSDERPGHLFRLWATCSACRR